MEPPEQSQVLRVTSPRLFASVSQKTTLQLGAPVSASAGSLLTASHEMMESMAPGIERTLDGLDRSMQKLSQPLSRTDTLVAATSEDVQRSLHTLRLMVERLESVLVRGDTLVQAKQGEIDETLTNLHAASAAVRELTEHPWKLMTGQGNGAKVEE